MKNILSILLPVALMLSHAALGEPRKPALGGNGAELSQDEIVPIEYLESTGEQFINLGMAPWLSMRIKGRFFITPRSQWTALFGAMPSLASQVKNAVTLRVRDTSPRLVPCFSRRFGKDVDYVEIPDLQGRWIDFSLSNGRFEADDALFENEPVSSLSCDSPLLLFAYSQDAYGASAPPNMRGKCAWFQLYDSEMLVLDLMPVRIGTRGYMLDTVSGGLFDNSGTGDFLLGPDL